MKNTKTSILILLALVIVIKPVFAEDSTVAVSTQADLPAVAGNKASLTLNYKNGILSADIKSATIKDIFEELKKQTGTRPPTKSADSVGLSNTGISKSSESGESTNDNGFSGGMNYEIEKEILEQKVSISFKEKELTQAIKDILNTIGNPSYMLSYKKDKSGKYAVSGITIKKRGSNEAVAGQVGKRELQAGEMEITFEEVMYEGLKGKEPRIKYKVRAKNVDVNDLLNRLSEIGGIHDKIVFDMIDKRIDFEDEDTHIKILVNHIFDKLRPKIYNVKYNGPEWDKNKNLTKAGYIQIAKLSDTEIHHRREQAELKNAEGSRLMQQGKYMEAIKSFGNAGDPDYISPTLNLGKIYMLNRNYDDAIKYFERALDIDKNNPEAYIYLIEVYENTDRIEKALESMETYIKLSKDETKIKEISKKAEYLKDKSVREYYDLLKQGDELKNKKDTEEAENTYEKAILLKPELISAYKKLGAIYEEKKDYKNAEEIYKKVIERDSNNYKSYTELARMYAEAGRFKDAVGMLTKATQVCPVKDTVLQINRMIEALKEGMKDGR